MPPIFRLMTAVATLLVLAGLAPAWGQNTALPHASASGFQPLVIPAQSAPLVLPQPIRIPTAILPTSPSGQPAQYQFDETPVAQPSTQPQQLQYGLPPSAPTVPAVTSGQQQAAFWERQGRPLRLWPLQPAPSQTAPSQTAPSQRAPVQPASPQQGYGQLGYPQVIYQQPVYPQAIYPPVIYQQPAYQQPAYQQPAYPQVIYQRPATPSPAPTPLAPSQPRSLGPIPEFTSGKGALQGYKQAAQLAKAQMGSGHIVAQIDLSEQRMIVSVNGKPWYDWPVSTGRKGYRTPTGTWGIQRMHRHYKSRKYDNAPMPHAMFFNGPYAIHGTNAVRRLGRTASHGCVRLHPKNAAMLFTLAEVFGKDWMTVKVQR